MTKDEIKKFIFQLRMEIKDLSISRSIKKYEAICSKLEKLEKLLIENKVLEEERDKLSLGREAIEGVARTELGLIKPGETFYVFKEAEEESPKTN